MLKWRKEAPINYVSTQKCFLAFALREKLAASSYVGRIRRSGAAPDQPELGTALLQALLPRVDCMLSRALGWA